VTTLESLSQRVTQLEATLDIMKLEGRYAKTWDVVDAKGWASLFTADGIFERVDVPGKPGHRQVGRSELESFCRTVQKDFALFHMLHTYDIDVAPDLATATSRITFDCRTMALGRLPRPGLITGYYETDYLKSPEGWLIEHRRERQVFLSEQNFYGIE
jgi:hypothetical protein